MSSTPKDTPQEEKKKADEALETVPTEGAEDTAKTIEATDPTPQSTEGDNKSQSTVPAPDVISPAENTKKDEEKPRSRPARKDGEKETADNEIMVAAKGKIKSYLGYAFRILNKTDFRTLKIKATGNAIVKALILVELIKKKVGEIHNYDLH